MKFPFLCILALGLPLFANDAPPGRDGKIFDHGLTMTKKADNAPPEMDNLAPMVGQWDVTWQVPAQEGKILSAPGTASITWMNRGHGLMERLHLDDFNGKKQPRDELAFYCFQPTTQMYGVGIADSYTKAIKVYSGKPIDGNIIMQNMSRPQGGMNLIMERYQINIVDKDNFNITLNISNDMGSSWNLVRKKTYKRRAPSADFMPTASDYGSPAPNRIPGSDSFDFLIGEWDAAQDITFPNGQNAKFPSSSTAVYMMNGHAILEFNSYDVDPQLPNSATSIIRLFNPAMSRWESLYITNRGNGLLHFGGNQKGDRIVLTNFETNMAAATVSFYVFHSIEEDKYLWEAQSTNDYGKSFQSNWNIVTTRKK